MKELLLLTRAKLLAALNTASYLRCEKKIPGKRDVTCSSSRRSGARTPASNLDACHWDTPPVREEETTHFESNQADEQKADTDMSLLVQESSSCDTEKKQVESHFRFKGIKVIIVENAAANCQKILIMYSFKE